ncbi:MAG: hypothetical protein F6K31_27120 [Symploca sp. SIO2G7]|nr:hypothetical protein [Symploca sp. SIO2G7]
MTTITAMADNLNISRGKLYRLLKSSEQYAAFKASGLRESENNQILYAASDWEAILSDVGYVYPACSEESEQPDATSDDTPVVITVVEGNHRNTLAAPQFPTEFNLGSMRSELATVAAHDDPLALAEQFINGADSLMDAMAEDEKAMAQKIAQTRQARQAVGRKVDQLKRRNDIYALRTELLADRQNVETSALNNDFEVLQSMGKRPGA